MASRDLVLEVGVEELPATYVDIAVREMTGKAEEFLSDSRLNYRELRSYAAPRRIVLSLRDLEEEQAPLKRESKGPPASAAFDEEGQPTQAAAGFARAKGVTVEELEVRETDRGPYVFAVRTAAGEQTQEVLTTLLPEVISSLEFPRTMRWGDNDFRFPRPIRWLLALYGAEVIEFELAGVRSGRTTRGHRVLGGRVEIRSAADYDPRLREEYVLVDPEERRSRVLAGVEEIAAQRGGQPLTGDGLLGEVANLVEYPTPLVGSFAERYLDLPREVLTTVMRKHQRYFPVVDERGALRSCFVAVRNGGQEHLATVRSGNEKVLSARLADARFFYEEDLKEPLAEKVSGLRGIIFHEDLGTVYEKVERVREIVTYLAEVTGCTLARELKRAARLAKADLLTHMVEEFPELEGQMGGEYARASGEKESVARAIAEHYRPRFSGDQLPTTEHGRLLSLADKLDTVVGCFAVGIRPTGSQDPYGLRRQTTGIVRILLTFNRGLSLCDLITQTMGVFTATKGEEFLVATELRGTLLKFIHQRFEYLLAEEFDRDVIAAAMTAGSDDLVDLRDRIQAVHHFRRREDFASLLTAFKRAANLADKLGTPPPAIDTDLFSTPAETELYNELRDVEHKVGTLTEQGADYQELLAELAALREPVDRFFEEVLVMAKEERVRNNRLLLLTRITGLFTAIADFSQIIED